MRTLIVVMTALILAAQASAEKEAGPTELAGDELYDALCSVCHGKYGRGDGPVASHLEVPLPDFTLAATLGSKSDEDVMAHLASTSEDTAKRHSPMPMDGLVKDGELGATVAYIRSMAIPGRHVSVRAGQDLYNALCWLCHGVKGDGQGPAAANLGDKKPRDFTSAEFKIVGREGEINSVISSGAEDVIHGSKYMIEWSSKLTQQQINDIIEYLRSF